MSVNETSMRPWSDLPMELVDSIASNLSHIDQIRMLYTCKDWRTISVAAKKRWPLLLYLPNEGDGEYKLFDPIVGKVYTTGDGTTVNDRLVLITSSNDGWVLLGDGYRDLVAMKICEEECLEVIDLPNMSRYCMDGVAFSSPPTRSDCVAFGISGCMHDSYVVVRTWRYGEDSWRNEWYMNNFPFLVSNNNPVFRNGVFYCLGRNGNLGVFDPETVKWSVLEPIYHTKLRDGNMRRAGDVQADMVKRNQERCYLVESSRGELLLIFDYNNGKPIRVMKLDEMKMVWRKIEDLGGDTIFVDTTRSISVPAPSKGLENRIYFARHFSDDHGQPKEGAFYCLKSKKYYTNFRYELRKKTNCVWVLPSI